MTLYLQQSLNVDLLAVIRSRETLSVGGAK